MSNVIGYTIDRPLESIKTLFSGIPAAEVAELFLSPFVSARLLNESTSEEGPSLWIVNRSDVYNETLEALSAHPLPAISGRAKEKLSMRRSQLVFLSPPEAPENLEETPDYMVEDLLGHPLVPLHVPLHFTTHLLEDFRSSAALSLTRRLLEHAPNWSFDLGLKKTITDRFFELLTSDSSPMVRAYSARIPLFDSSQIAHAYKKETHPYVKARLLQNPSSKIDSDEAPETLDNADAQTLYFERVRALDSRLPSEWRKLWLGKHQGKDSADPLATAIHSWHLQNGA